MELKKDKIKTIKGNFLEIQDVCEMFDYTEEGLKKHFKNNNYEMVKFKTLIPIETVFEMLKQKEIKKIKKDLK